MPQHERFDSWLRVRPVCPFTVSAHLHQWTRHFRSAELEIIIRYMVEDGLITTEFSPEELFPDADILKT